MRPPLNETGDRSLDEIYSLVLPWKESLVPCQSTYGDPVERRRFAPPESFHHLQRVCRQGSRFFAGLEPKRLLKHRQACAEPRKLLLETSPVTAPPIYTMPPDLQPTLRLQ